MTGGTPVEASGNRIRIHCKVVPGGSRDALLGPHGDRIRIKVSAPPEGGKANRAVIALLASALGVPKAALSIVSGHGNPRKTVEVQGLDVETVGRVLYGVSR